MIDIQCKDCGTNPTLQRKQNRTLVVKCACSSRSVKVSKALPPEWNV